VDAAAAKFDEEEDVEATQGDRLDGEEVTGEHARGRLAKKAAQLGASRRGAGSSPALASRRRTVLGERQKPSLISSPVIL
jgi:hypothetical protein